MRHLVRIATVGILGLALGCSDPPRVVQGKVVSYDATKKVLVLEDENAPHLQRSLDLASAEVGAQPAPGHLVRAAYHDRDGRMVAGRVMNLTAQKKQK
jgi:hypothetical protein